MRFRIGINVGDVVVDGDNLLGDGVNVAVRLENIAQPGAILISASVRDHIAGKIAETVEDLGNQFLKNIPKPVRVYRVVFDDEESRVLADRARRLGARSYATIAAIALLALGLGWWTSQTDAPTKASRDPSAAPGSATDDERTYWQVVSQSRDPDELKAFLKRYPHSTFAEIAQARLNGLLAGRAQHAQNAELVQKSAEAARAQAEAARLKSEADTAIARAASEQASAMRLKAEAELAAVRAAAASKAVVDAQQRLARPGSSSGAADEQIVLVRSISPYDGRWTADWNCEASAEQPSSTLKLPVLIQYREIRIETGQVGLPGYFRAYGRIAEDGSFDLKGTSLPKTQRIVGSEQSLAASGRGEMDKFEGHGSIGTRRLRRADRTRQHPMKAVWYAEQGDPGAVLRYGEQPDPHAARGEVRVALRASGVNPADMNRRSGRGYAMEGPLVIPHSDGSGIVDEVGSGVDERWLGRRVWLYNGQRGGRLLGTAAQYISLDAGLVAELPGTTSFEEGACLGIPCMTAHRCVTLADDLPGKTVLVSGGAGAVSHYAVQWAKRLGARVIAR